jgi:hypothetical protein
MKASWLGWAGVVALGMVMAGGACGGDDPSFGGSGPGTGTGTGTATGTETGMGGSGTGTASGTGTGAGGGDMCDPDNRCQEGSSPEFCACRDCWVKEQCNEQSNCNNDGQCTQKEGCFCDDCASLPECQDYCVSCEEYLTYYSSTDALCTGSDALWQALDSCACGSSCAAECDLTLCNGLGPSAECQTCIDENCLSQWDACQADKVERVLCNPVTNEGCAAQNVRCDRLINSALPQNGFQCYLNNTVEVCDSCVYQFGSNSYCAGGTTCVDANGGLTEAGTCAQYCCTDGDCGTGSCVKGAFLSDVGVCFDGAGGGAGMVECMPPMEPPSMGSCVTPE